MRRAAMMVAAVLTTSLSVPAMAGALANEQAAALTAFGRTAGYIVATVPYCGGNEDEVVYFTRQVRVLLEQIGGDAADWSAAEAAISDGRAEAEPKPADCTNDGGRDLADELVRRRNAMGRPKP